MISCVDILDALPDTTLIEGLDENHDFWVSARNTYDPPGPYPYRIKFSDPTRFSGPVKQGVFGTILHHLQAGALSLENILLLIDRFSAACSREEWTRWYRPILERSMILPLSRERFNTLAPQECRVRLLEVPKVVSVKKTTKLPSKMILEPWMDLPRQFWKITQGRIEGISPEGDPVHNPLVETWIETFRDKLGSRELTIDGFVESDEVFLIRTFDWGGSTSLLEQDTKLYEFLSEYPWDGIEVIEHWSPHTQSLQYWINFILEQNYPGFIIRDLYFKMSDVLVHPSKTMTLTCTSLSEENHSITLIHGEGMRGKTKITVSVFYGLNSTQRKQFFEERDSLVGKSFQIVHCGPSKDGGLMFPVFKHWKE